MGDCEGYEEDSDSKAGEVLNQALDGVSQAVQDPGQSGGEIEERTEECQDLQKDAGVLVSVEDLCQLFSEKEEDSS